MPPLGHPGGLQYGEGGAGRGELRTPPPGAGGHMTGRARGRAGLSPPTNAAIPERGHRLLRVRVPARPCPRAGRSMAARRWLLALLLLFCLALSAASAGECGAERGAGSGRAGGGRAVGPRRGRGQSAFHGGNKPQPVPRAERPNDGREPPVPPGAGGRPRHRRCHPRAGGTAASPPSARAACRGGLRVGAGG